jgi:hypothetical protein
VPAELEPERVLHLGHARAAEAGRGVHRARIGRDAVDVRAREAGVRDRGEAGVEREAERIAAEPPPDVGLPDPRDGGLSFPDLHPTTSLS